MPALLFYARYIMGGIISVPKKCFHYRFGKDVFSTENRCITQNLFSTL